MPSIEVEADDEGGVIGELDENLRAPDSAIRLLCVRHALIRRVAGHLRQLRIIISAFAITQESQTCYKVLELR